MTPGQPLTPFGHPRRRAAPPGERAGDSSAGRRAGTPLGAAPSDADVLICGASFAGLAAARELKGRNVLIVDRYEIGERATSACAAPTPWLHAMGVENAIRQEIPCMAFHTPHGSARFRLPWSWSSFDYRTLCQELFAQTDARFEIAKVHERAWRHRRHRPRRAQRAADHRRARLAADARQDATSSRRTRRSAAASRSTRTATAPTSTSGSTAPSSATATRGASPPHGEQRIGVGSYEPTHHVKEPTKDIAHRLQRDAVRYQGNWFPHRLRPATEDGIFFAGDSAGHCIPLSGEGIRTAFYFGIAAAREIAQVIEGTQTREQALSRYAAFSARHAPAYEAARALQYAIPRLPPQVLTRSAEADGPRAPVPARLRLVPHARVPKLRIRFKNRA